MKIKKIKKLSSIKYKIEFEDAESIITYDDIILKNNILLKKEIDADLYIKLQQENSYYDIYSKVVKYIITKLRSEKEIKEYLKKYTEETILVDKIIDQLYAEGLLNEERYIKAYIEDKINLSSLGPLKIKKELLSLELDENLIDQYLNKYDELIFEEKIKKLIDKKVRLNKKNSKYKLKQKIEKELYDLGYPIELIKNNINIVDVNEKDIIEVEIKKLYNKLSKKYNGNELKYQIKNKLYQKGFSVDSIDIDEI